MRDFFNGWRRKVGCATLVMALLFIVAWMRSRIVHDFFAVGIARPDDISKQHIVVARNDAITWSSWDLDMSEGLADGGVFGLVPTKSERFVDDINARRPRPSFREWRIPYWQITLPPTLVSISLILYQPRSKPMDRSDA